MGIFNWKKKNTKPAINLPLYLRSEEEVERKVEAILAETSDAPAVVNGEEKRRALRPIEDEYKQFRTFALFHMCHLLSVSPLEVDHVVITLSENLLGDRIFTVLRNGLIDSRTLPMLVKTQEWREIILPWINNETDDLPSQGFEVIEETMNKIRDFRDGAIKG